ncbi:MAG: hypothetical protein QOJ07_2168 [Thermoleophilaceae bacterium]|nr:hypothetical protein [Thermoleophilaceae bacterium]
MGHAVVVVAALVAAWLIVAFVNAHGKARAYEQGEIDLAGDRAPEDITSLHLPPPHFHTIDPEDKERER